MTPIPLFAGHAFIELGGDRYHLEVVRNGVLVSGGVLARPVPIGELVNLVLELGASADQHLEQTAGAGRMGSESPASAPLSVPDDEQPTATCPRCQHESHEIFQSRCCARCGHCWRAPPDREDGVDIPARRDGCAE